MRAIQGDSNLSQREMASQLGVSLGGVNYCLKALIDIGWIKVGNLARNENKRSYIYLLTPKGVSEKAALTARFLRRKVHEYESIKSEIKQLQVELANDAL